MSAKHLAWLILGSAAGLNTISWGLALFVFPRDNPATILHYSMGVGIDFIGQGTKIISLPLAGAAILGGNWLVGSAVRRISKEGTWLLWGMAFVAQVVVVASLLLLWQQNL